MSSAGIGGATAGGTAAGVGAVAYTGFNSLVTMVVAAVLILAGLVLVRLAAVGRRKPG